jgi:hypothetical protein
MTDPHHRQTSTTHDNPKQQPASRLLYPRKEAAAQICISVRMLDHYIVKGKINTLRIGSRVLIPHDELLRFAARDHNGMV